LLPVPQEELCGPVIFPVVNFHHFAKKKKKEKENRKRRFCHKFLVLKEVLKKRKF